VGCSRFYPAIKKFFPEIKIAISRLPLGVLFISTCKNYSSYKSV
jgi:hypothetical protein